MPGVSGVGEALARYGAEGLCRAGRRAARAEGHRHGPVRRRCGLAAAVPQLLRALGRHADRGDRGDRHRALGHHGQGHRPAGAPAAGRHGARADRRLRVVDPLARRCRGDGAGPSAVSSGASRRSRSRSGRRSRPRSRGRAWCARSRGRTSGSRPTPTGSSTSTMRWWSARALAELDYFWFEEPIVPEDLDGYRWLREQAPLRLAAGESEHTAQGAAPLLDRARGRRDPAGRRALGRDQRDAADRRGSPRRCTCPTRRMSARAGRSASRRACSSPPRCRTS